MNAPHTFETLPAGVVDLTHDSRQVRPGWAFACVPGQVVDGHDYAVAAVAAGAAALVVEHPVDGVGSVPQVVVADVRAAMGPLAAAVHGDPSTRLTMVGITGTNGKTTTTHLLAAILDHAGRATRVIGTLSGARTTPEAPDLQRQLAGYVAEGADAVVMEVSSHALALHRVAGAHFDAAVFTNLSRDHLDLHGSMEGYFAAKAQLFVPGLSSCGVVNVDDAYGARLAADPAIPIAAYTTAQAADVVVRPNSVTFTWHPADAAPVPVRVPIGGRFNVNNALAALTTAVQLGLSPADAAAGLAEAPAVPGRFETVSGPGSEFAVVVDYAHTPDGIVEVLRAAREVAGTGRVLVVFGCGGDRDPDKRPLMGGAAARGADVVVVTSDNPRSEPPMAIIDAAVAGARAAGASPIVEPDRRAAIAAAFAEARRGDVVVIAGKGHETYQTIGTTDHPFDDRAVARALLGALAGEVRP